MVAKMWWSVLVLARACIAYDMATLCDHESCDCDAFTAVTCDCENFQKKIILQPEGDYRIPIMATSIAIYNCSEVHLLTNTLKKLFYIRKVELMNINKLNIESHSMAWSPRGGENDMHAGLRIVINNCTISEISSNSIQGKIQTIHLYNSIIRNLKPFAFSSLADVHTIEMKNNKFEYINIQAFKKFTTNNFIIEGGELGVIPSRFLSDIEINDVLRIERTKIDHLNSLSFLVNSPKTVLLESNIIGTLAGDAFHIRSKGPIVFRNNSIRTIEKGAFLGFTVDPYTVMYKGKQEFIFHNNTVIDLSEFSLSYDISTLTIQVDSLNLNIPCECQLMKKLSKIIITYNGSILCRFAIGQYISIPTYVTTLCQNFHQYLYTFIFVGLLLLLTVAIIVIFFIFKQYRSQSQIVMPDGKTYKETEFHIVVERAELLMTEL